MITRSNIRTQIRDSRSYHGTTLNSDHRIVICDCDIKWYQVYKNKTKSCSRLNVSNLRDPEIKHKYQNKVKEQVQHIENIQWSDIVSAVLSAGEEVLGKQTSASKPTPNKTISDLSKIQLNLRLQKESCSDTEKRSLIQKQRNKILKQIKKEVKLEKGKEQISRIENVEACKDDSRRMFAAVRELN